MQNKNKNSRRKFIRQCALGTGACLYGVPGLLAANNEGWEPKNFRPGKHSIEAIYYLETPRGLKCLLCPNECTITKDEPGDCRTRIAYENKLYSIAYGNPCALHVDPIEKKPLYHFLPSTRAFSIATAGCNLACLNCQNWQISQKSPKETRNYDLMPGKVYQAAQEYQCKSIAYTYSEPIVFYEYVRDSSLRASEHGIRNVLISAGYINEKPLREMTRFIDAANIDLKSFEDEIYMRLNAGGLDPVLRTLKILKEEGVWLEITNLIVPDWTDDPDMIKKMCDWLASNGFEDTPLHFSRFQPMYKLKHLPATPEHLLYKAKEIAENAGLRFVYIGNLPGSKAQHTYCPECHELLIERKGYQVQQNRFNDGKCENCGTKIPGVWK